MTKKLSSFISSIKFAKLDPKHDKGPKGSTDDEEIVSEMNIGKKKPKSDTHHIVDKEGKTLSLASYLDKASAVKDLEKHPGGKVVTLGPRGKVKEEVEITTEAKEKTEYDYEGDMARGQLQSIISNAQRVHDMLEDNDNLPEWVQSKITLAEDYISTVANYMMSEVDEAVVIKTNKPIGFRVADIDPWSGKESNVKTDKAYDNAQAKKKLPQGADFAAQRRKERLASNGRMDEEQHSVLYKMKKDDEKIAVAHYKSKDDAHKFLSSVKTKGGNGIVRTKTNEEVEELEELSSDLLGRYKTAASKQASELDKTGNIKKADSRFRGIVKATKKQFANDLKKEASSPAQQAAIAIAMKKDGKKPMNETLEEGRPSQRHPLEGHEYHKKTNAELEYIAKDAHKAADAMKSHNTDAENKYRDQANDSATVRYFRQKNGMPDWYKKKYGHVKESVEVLDGEEMQASEIIDNIQESRKKAIVREALKDAKERMEKKGKKEEKKDAMGGKGDKFEAEPHMTSLVNDKQ